MGKFQRDADKEAFWRLAIGEQVGSGLSVRGFCAREGLSENNFYAWRRQLSLRDAERSSASAGPAFVEVRADSPLGDDVQPPGDIGALSAGQDVAAALELVLSNGVMVRVREGFDAATLRRLIEVLS
jgi:transposase